MAEKRAVLLINGELEDVPAIAPLARSADLLIAVDGGLRYLRDLDLRPDVLIGDLDSVPPEWVEQCQAQGVRVLRYPVEKDDTDLELALDLALKDGCTEIRLAGALGGRLDQTLANVFLLMKPELEQADVRIVDPGQEIFLIRSEHEIQGAPEEIVSLLPLLGPALGVTTEGLYYPLRGETLYPYRTRGVSNVMLGERAVVRVEQGVLLCIHSISVDV